MTQEVEADVCLIVEGAYPFVVGGVSAWLQDLMENLPGVTFAIVAIKADGDPQPARLTPPPNVVGITELALAPDTQMPRRIDDAAAASIADALVRFLAGGGVETLHALIDRVGAMKGVPRAGDIMAHPAVFARLQRFYRAMLPNASFHHYFWAMRVLLGGLLAVLTGPLPRARVYHTISTGFAGLLAARAARQTGRPAFITEHGIYLLERQIEVMMADWIGDQVDTGLELDRSVRDLRDLWVRAFTSYAGACYEACDPIVALYGDNNAVQRRLGAPPQRVRAIPNGIDASRFDDLADMRDPAAPLVALLGRVVPIKDVKTFVRAAALVHAERPDVRFAVLGPADEDAGYAAECAALVAQLGIGDVFSFEGRVRIDEWLPRVDLLVLTSLSEAQPLVILEGGACGIPVVAPDVGSCREMIEGRGGADSDYGGIVTPLVNPGATAAAIRRVLSEPGLRDRMGQAMRARVLRDYDHATIIGAYRDIYRALARG
ncbi:GT4 family glycosyltransferase PelF [Sphingomonas corticis]|jgi:glycosyltransferase involved in cell wall biosynthesis|uniref:GT4 family glycosyltransferase PelF n=1 Tax=Sphingomonas corticis TaxID=2722791 RepID=A0ABX1CNE2_9SPHN|nr:GT4 family glycosyltransferase PelF [Sphingomonas corticis]NJR78183.1 GT4 family glycosyltransferase PelF [Sphingomonas corticis]